MPTAKKHQSVRSLTRSSLNLYQDTGDVKPSPCRGDHSASATGRLFTTIFRRVCRYSPANQVLNLVDVAAQNLEEAKQENARLGTHWHWHCALHGIYPRAREPLPAVARNGLQDLTEAVTRLLRGCSETRRRRCAVPGGWRRRWRRCCGVGCT